MKAAGNPWIKFYPSDWRADPALRSCTIGARGLWIEMLCIMHEAEPYGSLLIKGKRIDKKQLASLCGIPGKECTVLILELEGFGVFERDLDGTIYSRRMRRDRAKAINDKENGGLGGSPDLLGASVPKEGRQRRFSRKDNPTKVEAVWESSLGSCNGCGCLMQRDLPNELNAFTVDHIISLAQGGDNSIGNLQALCRACNRRKGITPPDEKTSEGDKAQKPEARSQIIDRIGGAGASNFTEGSKALTSAFWKALGFESPIDVPPQFAGVDWRAVGWETAGWTVDLIDAETRRVGPDKPLTYYEKVFATSFAKRQAPLPIVEIREAEKLTVSHGKNQSGVVAAARRFAEQFEKQSSDCIEGDPDAVLRLSQG